MRGGRHPTTPIFRRIYANPITSRSQHDVLVLTSESSPDCSNIKQPETNPRSPPVRGPGRVSENPLEERGGRLAAPTRINPCRSSTCDFVHEQRGRSSAHAATCDWDSVAR